MTNSNEAVVTLLEGITTPIAEAKGAYIIEIAIRGERGGKVVEVFLDSDEGLSTAICAAISRELSESLDAQNIIPGKYQLVVSSPGIERPLKYPRQYGKHVGRSLRITREKSGAKDIVEGTLESIGETGIELMLKSKTRVAVAFDEINEAKVIPPW